MDSESQRKLLKNDGIDWISDMPYSILHKILSYVPTKNAVSTSILSTKWNNIFPIFVPPVKLDLDDSQLLYPEENNPNLASDFVDFVDKILDETLVNRLAVDTLILKCMNNYGDEDITTWVTSALRLKLRELTLRAYLYDSESLFRALCGCLTLVRFEICGTFLLRVPKDLSFCLPNLKELSLANLVFNDEDEERARSNLILNVEDEEVVGSINRLLYGCQALESLCIRSCEFESKRNLCIKSNLLKKLTIQDSWNDTGCGLQIIAPNLEILFYSDFVAKNYSNSMFPCLLEGYVDVRKPSEKLIDEIIADDANIGVDVEDLYCTAVHDVVAAFFLAVRLYISAPSVEALVESTLPKFQKLTCLSLGCIGLAEWEVLARFLQSAPNLEKLTLQEGFSEPIGGFAYFKRCVRRRRPLCLKLKLKEIDYWAYKEEEDEIKLLEYFLFKGKRLEILKLHWFPYEELGKSSRLLTLPRNCYCHYNKTENGMQISVRRNG